MCLNEYSTGLKSISIKENKKDYSIKFKEEKESYTINFNFDNYTIQHRLERYIYLGDDRQLTHRFCQGKEIAAPKI